MIRSFCLKGAKGLHMEQRAQACGSLRPFILLYFLLQRQYRKPIRPVDRKRSKAAVHFHCLACGSFSATCIKLFSVRRQGFRTPVRQAALLLRMAAEKT